MGRERLLDAVDEVMDFTELAGLQNQMIDKLSKGRRSGSAWRVR